MSLRALKASVKQFVNELTPAAAAEREDAWLNSPLQRYARGITDATWAATPTYRIGWLGQVKIVQLTPVTQRMVLDRRYFPVAKQFGVDRNGNVYDMRPYNERKDWPEKLTGPELFDSLGMVYEAIHATHLRGVRT